MEPYGPITNPQKPLDDVLGTIASGLASNGMGFALGLLERAGVGTDGSKKIEVEVRETIPPVDTYEPPPPLRAHSLGDADSLIAFAKRYGKADESLVLYNDAGICLVLNEEPGAGQREQIGLNWTFAQDHRDWSGVVNQKAVDHRTLLKFLILHAHNLEDAAVLMAMRSVSATTTVKMESDLKDEGDTVGVVCVTGKGEELKRFPKEIAVLIPILRDDVDAGDSWRSLSIRIEVEMPTEPNRPVTFLLLCNEWDVTKSRRIDAEVQKVREGLASFLIVRGEHKQTPRKIGAKANGIVNA